MEPYIYVGNNPIVFVDPDGRSPDDIILRGSNNSSVTIKTDLVDIDINAGSIVGDLGGNYSFEGDDILVAGLDIAGVVDPTGVADVAAASIEAKNGNYGSALLSGLGVIPYVGDVAKIGKIGKHTKTIKNAIESVSKGGKKGTDYIVTPKGQTIKIPDGASGPVSPNKGSGMMYQGGSGGKGMDSRTTGVRIMDANKNQGRRVNYMNKSGQTVDPKTGRTISNKDPRGHLPLKDY